MWVYFYGFLYGVMWCFPQCQHPEARGNEDFEAQAANSCENPINFSAISGQLTFDFISRPFFVAYTSRK